MLGDLNNYRVVMSSMALFITGYFRGAVGFLSITTILLLIISLIQRLFNRFILKDAERSIIFQGITLAGMVLYPTALGFSPIDIYRLGYKPLTLLFILLLFAVLAWLLEYHIGAMFIVIAVIAFNLQIFESQNLWDYLIDPFVMLYALGWIVFQIFTKRNFHLYS